MRISQLRPEKDSIKETEKQNNNTPELEDSRLRNPIFKAAVKQVLDYLSEENTFGNFKKYDRQYNSSFCIDWVEFAARLNNPIFEAFCYVLDYAGNRIQLPDGRWLKKTVDIAALTRVEAEGIIKKNIYYEFIEWR